MVVTPFVVDDSLASRQVNSKTSYPVVYIHSNNRDILTSIDFSPRGQCNLRFMVARVFLGSQRRSRFTIVVKEQENASCRANGHRP